MERHGPELPEVDIGRLAGLGPLTGAQHPELDEPPDRFRRAVGALGQLAFREAHPPPIVDEAP